MKPTIVLCSAVITALLLVASTAYADGGNGVLYQVSTFEALESGYVAGQEYLSGLLEHGGFGIGTFDKLDGDMVALDGEFYRVKANGLVDEAEYNSKVSFALVTLFEPDFAWRLPGNADRERLEAFLDEVLQDDGLLYAIKVKGHFISVNTGRTRSIFGPYKTSDYKEYRGEYSREAIVGTLVGFRMPYYMDGLDLPGYHFHFLSSDLKFGGRAFDFEVFNADVEADKIEQFYVSFPEADFDTPADVQDTGLKERNAYDGRYKVEIRNPASKSEGVFIKKQGSTGWKSAR